MRRPLSPGLVERLQPFSRQPTAARREVGRAKLLQGKTRRDRPIRPGPSPIAAAFHPSHQEATTVSVSRAGHVPAAFHDMSLLQKINEETNVKVVFEGIASAQVREKVNLMFASRMFPGTSDTTSGSAASSRYTALTISGSKTRAICL